MKIRPWVLSLVIFTTMVSTAAWYRTTNASDHDDGESEVKARSLNLTDHYVWKEGSGSATIINLVQTSNPRSLPGQQYFFSTQARYEFHVTRLASRTATATGVDDVTFRFAFGSPDASNVQTATLTVLKAGAVVGSATGSTTPIDATATVNTVEIGGVSYKFFAGLREDTFVFDVQRFFEVRDFLATAFFGGGSALVALDNFQDNHKTCDNRALYEGFDQGFGGDTGGASPVASGGNGDPVHLFNPPECAEDFTKLYNRNEIELQMPRSALQSNGETVFDTWSTISIPR